MHDDLFGNLNLYHLHRNNMFWFWKKEKSLEDKFLETLRQSDIVWNIRKDSSYDIREISGWWMYFKDYFGTKTKDGAVISHSFFEKVYKLAKEMNMQRDIKRLWWVILDDDLQAAINDTKKILSAKGQIENLVSVIEKIRSKY